MSQVDPDFYAANVYAASQPAYVAAAFDNWGQTKADNSVANTVPSESK